MLSFIKVIARSTFNNFLNLLGQLVRQMLAFGKS